MIVSEDSIFLFHIIIKGVFFMPTFSNQAQLSYNGITTNSNIAYGQIL